MSSTPYVTNWGILSCGGISTQFVTDMVRDPATRGVKDVAHAVVAVGARDKSKAEQFIKNVCPKGAYAQIAGYTEVKPEAFQGYEAVVNHPKVDIIYIGTRHITHYDDCKLALEAGKHVLLEKPATLNAAEFKDLSKIAKAKNLFLMEAVWTRFNPTLLALQKAIHEDRVIGEPRALFSEFFLNIVDTQPKSHRLLDPASAGGALLDLGPYPLNMAMSLLYRHPDNKLSAPENVQGSMLLNEDGIDIATSYSLNFPKLKAKAFLSVGLLYQTLEKSHTRIIGTKGEIHVNGGNGGPTSCPMSFEIRRYTTRAKTDIAYESEIVANSFDGVGLFWEADGVARYLRDGATEAKHLPLAETQITMDVFDKVRQDGGYKLPPGLEKVTA